MEYFNSDYFTYSQNELLCEQVPLTKLAKEFGTPLFVYSKKFFADRYNELSEAFREINHKIFYASKANYNINVIKIFNDLGGGVDVNSAGELFRALKAGVEPQNILLTGVGKTDDEIRLGLEKNVYLIKAESEEEVLAIDKIAGEMGKTASVAIRVNPDVDPKTHPYISTGLAENKFGVDAKLAYDLIIRSSKLNNIALTGIDMHIGSQITTIEPFVEATIRMVELYKKIQTAGIPLEHFDVGGGIGVLYKDEAPFTPKELAKKLIPIFMQIDAEIIFEPGRFLTANGGVLLTEVLFTKKNSHGKNFTVVDAAMTELLRPSIYKAYHHIQPVRKNNEKDIVMDVVGPVCESGDYLAKNRTISKVSRKDVLAVMSAGAYGMVMSSNYNGRRRPPEIIIDKDKYYLIRSRETFEHLLYDEEIIDLAE
ncbi:Diaminopimelate decarboxylase [hydrothermal vent metagenome]|uniref:diaminopimelate decarboxylase n=1 Tax=hydrothermal vent metagenome TaxID=652676 RepID=A0A3B1D5F2_9ZZZZ